MRWIFTLFSSLLIVLNCNSQSKTIKGEIRNSESDTSLPYVNIGIANKTVGTVSNIDGLFNLDLNNKVKLNDTVIFSYVGFKTEKYLVSELTIKNKTIFLSPENVELSEVIVNAKKIKYKSKKIGRTSKGLGIMHSNFYTYDEKGVDDRLSKERGMKLKVKSNCHIKDLNFNITSNDFTSLKFRVNFYKIENDLPTVLIVQKDIIFEIKDNFLGWFKVDLEPYKIYLKEDIEDVAVTIQWLESVKTDEKSKYFAISTAASPINTAYFREKAMDTWTKSDQSFSFYLNGMCN